MSIYDKDLFGKSKYETALATLRFHCASPKSGIGGYKRVLCAFSGGKDSQCCYHLLKDAGIPFSAQYSITRFEPPELMEFIRDNYPDVTFRRAYKRSLVDDICINGLPTRFSRWCCEAKHKKTEGFDIQVIGVRAAESARRANNWRTFGVKADRTAYLCPIFAWTDDDVWEYLNSKGVAHCRLYDEGYDRIGCMLCPLRHKGKEQDLERYPKTANMIKLGVRKFVERMRAQGFVSKKGKPCASWCKAEDPVEELFWRWVKTEQVQESVEEYERGKHGSEEEVCLFAGSGASESDGIGAEDP